MARNAVLTGEGVKALKAFSTWPLPVVGLVRMAHFSLVSYSHRNK